MYLHGWCYRCKKVKRVHVTMPPLKGVPIGLCRECEARR